MTANEKIDEMIEVVKKQRRADPFGVSASSWILDGFNRKQLKIIKRFLKSFKVCYESR